MQTHKNQGLFARKLIAFSKFLPNDLPLNPSTPNFQLACDNIKKNILTKFREYLAENLASRL